MRLLQDILLSIIVAFSALAAYVCDLNISSVFQHSLVALILYIAAIILPQRVGLIAATLFLSLIIHIPSELVTIVRLSMFAIIIATTSRPPWRVPPFVSGSMGWTFYLSVGILMSFINDNAIVTADGRLLLEIISELLIFAAIPLIRVFPTFSSSERLGHEPLNVTTFSIQVFAFIVILSTCLTLFVSAPFSFDSFQQMVDLVDTKVVHLAFLCGWIVATSIAAGLYFASLINKFIDKIASTNSSSKRMFADESIKTPLAELQLASKRIAQSSMAKQGELDQANSKIKELNSELANFQSTITDLKQVSLTLAKVIDNSPTAMISCSTKGTVLAINKTCSELLQVDKSLIIGHHFNKIKKNHPWNNEIYNLLSWGCENHTLFNDPEPLRTCAPPVEDHFLDCFLHVAKTDIKKPQPKDNHNLANVEVVVSVFARKHTDAREFQLARLMPSRFELIGSQTLAFATQLARRFKNVIGTVEDVKQILDRVQGNSGWKLKETDLGMEIAATINDIDRVIKAAANDVLEFDYKVNQIPRKNEEIDINIRLIYTLHYLHKLLNFDRKFKISFNDESLATRLNNIKSERLIVIQAPSAEIKSLLSYFLDLVRQVLEKFSTISIELEEEIIDTTSAQFIDGAKAGNFVRLVLKHHGQSLTGNMLQGSFGGLSETADEMEAIESALTLLSIQVNRLGGFISAQSNERKGTNLSIYIPTNTSDIARQSHTDIRKLAARAAIKKRALIVSSDEKLISPITEHLQNLNLEVEKQPFLNVVQGELEIPLEFGGSGFSEAYQFNREDDIDEFQGRYIDISVYDYVLFDGQDITQQTVDALQYLKGNHPSVQMLVLTHYNPQDAPAYLRALANWKKISANLESLELKASLQSFINQ